MEGWCDQAVSTSRQNPAPLPPPIFATVVDLVTKRSTMALTLANERAQIDIFWRVELIYGETFTQ